jgi:TolB-like protein
MITAEPIPLRAKAPKVSRTEVDLQLQKIVRDPIFADSEILKRFLIFVVNETLNEHANRLKEYTIAVQVLNKPSNFKTQESGIVRIHASRLRRALNCYYRGRGIYDNVRISIPRGSYVPIFDENMEPLEDRIESPVIPLTSHHKQIVVGVAPFRDSSNTPATSSLADGLGAQLSTALMHIDHFSVVAYYAMRSLYATRGDLEQTVPAIGANLLVTGDIQTLHENLRAHVQIIRVRTGQLLWSQMYEMKFYPDKMFELQDKIVDLVISEIEALEL